MQQRSLKFLNPTVVVRLAVAAAFVAACVSCGRQGTGQSIDADSLSSRDSAERAAGGTAPPVPPSHLRVRESQFIRPDDAVFQWRGITAFQLLEMLARGRRTEVERYLDWAASEKLSVVRVLSMARHLFDLAPGDGRTALPALLEMAASRGIHVELVALADTAGVAVDVEAHLAAVGQIASRHHNILVEIANEPTHPTQATNVHDATWLEQRARSIPEPVPVALGSVERGDGFAAGDYVTWHVPRETGDQGWKHVAETAAGAAQIERFRKPVVSDEPIGAAATHEPGRRDNSPPRFRAAALLTRLTGLGATFHYEGGLRAAIPEGRELECFRAWNEAWTLLPDGVETWGTFRAAGAPGAAVRGFSRGQAVAVFERQADTEAWVLAIGVRDDPRLLWSEGWAADQVMRLDGAWLIRARRLPEHP